MRLRKDPVPEGPRFGRTIYLVIVRVEGGFAQGRWDQECESRKQLIIDMQDAAFSMSQWLIQRVDDVGRQPFERTMCALCLALYEYEVKAIILCVRASPSVGYEHHNDQTVPLVE